MQHLRKTTAVVLLIVFCQTVFSQNLNWYPFDRDFINAKYSTSAIGDLSFTRSHAAQNVHSSSCGGKDAELHIGMTLDEVQLPNGQMPLSDSPSGSDQHWGVVAELPNTNKGDGKAKLGQLAGKPIKFFGYFRVWDEGHSVGAVHPSNPHHVFEIHPAWGFTGQGVNFSRKDLVAPMTSYRGFGATKFRPLLEAINTGVWPKAFRSGGKLHLGLGKSANFFQLPVRIRSVSSVSGGHEVKVDVYSNQAMTNKIYSGLTTITASGTPIDGSLAVGQKAFLLGFFSINLKKALESSEGATSRQDAVAVKDALEFFVFGRAVNQAVASCN